MKIFALMLAGALGALARYGLTLALQNWMQSGTNRNGAKMVLGIFLPADFPLGTLIVNVAGSFLLAVLMTLVLSRSLSPQWGLILGTGFLGAFTTFSTFEWESEMLLARGQGGIALLYILGNLVLGFGAIVLGRAVATRVLAAYT